MLFQDCLKDVLRLFEGCFEVVLECCFGGCFEVVLSVVVLRLF